MSTQTSTARNSCTAELWVDNGSGSITDVSGSTTTFSQSPDVEVGEFKTFASRWKKRLTCGLDMPVSVTLVYSTSATEAWAIFRDWFWDSYGAARTVTMYIPDKNVGADVFSGEFVLDDLDWTVDSSDAGPIIITASLLPDGEVTHTTAST